MPAKSSPTDFIPTPLIKSCPDLFSELIGLSFKSFFLTVTSYLHKNPPSDFRPVSNITSISKIIGPLVIAGIIENSLVNNSSNVTFMEPLAENRGSTVSTAAGWIGATTTGVDYEGRLGGTM